MKELIKKRTFGEMYEIVFISSTEQNKKDCQEEEDQPVKIFQHKNQQKILFPLNY